ncbi:MAG: sigma-54-dependent Fis family transcriptional regulator [Cyclobacteriaceae bacterium]|nr:sigma-54-dependent Fis family transcriptional regulator [Cyclobacteriaceae bacterium]
MAKSNAKILIADDDDMVLLSIKLLLEQKYTEIHTTNDPKRIPSLARQINFDVALLDMNFRQGDTSSTEGLFLLRHLVENHPETQVILMTAFGEIQLAVEAIKEGAMDFIVKPWENEKLQTTIANAVSLSTEKRKVRQLQSKQRTITAAVDSQYPAIIGNATPMREILQMVDKISGTDADILILGENGTGKEVIARNIHRKSNRADEVFISVDLGALSELLFESELFGHKKGAFTDAKEDRVGRIEAANGGTLFLDEIGNLSLPLQSKLLTFLQSRQVTRVGTNNPIDVDVRIICATNCNLQKLVKQNQFREDLLYRINTVEITIPPLRERSDDILLLSNHYLKSYSKKYQKNISPIDNTLESHLQKHDWPGNVRELQHAIERAVIMNESGVLTINDFQFLSSDNNKNPSFDNYNLEAVEAWAIKNAIKKHHGNISHAAKELGLSRGSLYRRMQRYGI